MAKEVEVVVKVGTKVVLGVEVSVAEAEAVTKDVVPVITTTTDTRTIITTTRQISHNKIQRIMGRTTVLILETILINPNRITTIIHLSNNRNYTGQCIDSLTLNKGVLIHEMDFIITMR